METYFDALVIGAGISGMQTANDLAEQGLKVLIIEKEPSIGGAMILLSKVFPTLDCASCITTPKMSSVKNHDNITSMTMSHIKSFKREGNEFHVVVRKEPRYVNEVSCTGCSKCEHACPVYRSDPFDFNLGVTKAIHLPFKNSIPLVAVLDMNHCIQCGACTRVCPVPDCINYFDQPEDIQITVGAVIQCTGFDLTPMDAKKEYHAEELVNVISPMQMERLLAPHGPYGGVLRPFDGILADSICFVQCAGSRDETLGVPYCSRVCCMYAIKQGMLLSGILPLADVTIYYMDIRTFGKGHELFYQNAKAMGIKFVKAKVAQVNAAENGNVKLRIEEIGQNGGLREVEHDLCVLSLGMVPKNSENNPLGLEVGEDGFIASLNPKISPNHTSQEGVFVAGTARGPKDIVDSIIEGSAAAMQASAYLQNLHTPEVAR